MTDIHLIVYHLKYTQKIHTNRNIGHTYTYIIQNALTCVPTDKNTHRDNKLNFKR